MQSAVDIVLRRFAEFHNLEGALGRRALTERAKGILMERHEIDEREAFELLRSHSRRTGRKLIDIAEAVATSHLLLLPPEAEDAEGPRLDCARSAAEARGARASQARGRGLEARPRFRTRLTATRGVPRCLGSSRSTGPELPAALARQSSSGRR